MNYSEESRIKILNTLNQWSEIKDVNQQKKSVKYFHEEAGSIEIKRPQLDKHISFKALFSGNL